MTAVLHSFPFSTYCEKGFWLLDATETPYTWQVQYAGPHATKMKKLSGNSSVPVLEIDGQVISGSDQIAAHVAPSGSALVPKDCAVEVLNWQARLDEIGAVLRSLFFLDLFTDRIQARDILTAGHFEGRISAYGTFFSIIYPLLRRNAFKELPDPEKAETACRSVLNDIVAQSADTGYLCGGRFTLADLTAASIFYPNAMPANALGAEFALRSGYLQPWLDRWADHPSTDYIRRIYRDHR